MDTKFSVALHILTYISETDKVVSSELLAKSVNTNSSHIRKILAVLKKGGLIESQQGKTGITLAKEPKDITLSEIYQIIYPDKYLVNIHEGANKECPVGLNIENLLQSVFNEAQEAFYKKLEGKTLEKLIRELYIIGEKETMKAAVHTKYNKNNIELEIRDVAVPTINENEVLVKVSAAGVNPLDNMISRGEVKIIVPYTLPQIAGNEVVGIIEQKGSNVANFEIGDRVFSRLPLDKIGAFAEYVAINQNAIAKVPDYLTDEEAAAVPLTALTIMQALELMGAQSGKTIFISGGTGGVGGMAIPIAKAKGLTVITNGSVENKERVEKLGVDQFIDYKTTDYTKVLKDVDYVLDTLGGAETEKQMTIMKSGGKLVSLRAMPNGSFAKRMNLAWWKQFILGLAGRKFDKMANKYGVSYDFIFVESNGKQLQEVADIFTKLEIKPSVDTVFDFKDVNKALDKVANGLSRGKTVLSFK